MDSIYAKINRLDTSPYIASQRKQSDMLLITTKPVNGHQNSPPIREGSGENSNDTCDHLRSYQRSRSHTGYNRDTDSGISAHSLSSSPRYMPTLERPSSPTRLHDNNMIDSYHNGLDTTHDLSMGDLRSRSSALKSDFLSGSGRFTPVSRGLRNSHDWTVTGRSQDWSNPGKSQDWSSRDWSTPSKPLSASRSRLSGSMQDLSGGRIDDSSSRLSDQNGYRYGDQNGSLLGDSIGSRLGDTNGSRLSDSFGGRLADLNSSRLEDSNRTIDLNGSRAGDRSSFLGSRLTSRTAERTQDTQRALEDSEDRRQLLVERLKDAQNTIKLQAKRLTDVEDVAKETTSTVEDLKFKEQDQRKKIGALEREKTANHDRYMDVLKARETLQQKIETLTAESAALRTTTELIQSDMSRKDTLIKQLNENVGRLEIDNHKLVKCKETMTKEVAALRQSLELSKSRSDFLENHGKDTVGEVTRLKEENFHLSQERVKLAQKMSVQETKNAALSEDLKVSSQSNDSLKQEKNQLTKRLSSLEATVVDLKSTLVTTSADKERFFQDKMDMTAQLQKLTYERDNLTKIRNTLEEQLCEHNADLAQVRLQMDKSGEVKRQQQEEMNAVKKVSEVLSKELSEVKLRLDHVLDQNASLEHNKTLAFQQHELYEQEIGSLEDQLKQSKTLISTMREDEHKEKESTDKVAISLKDELKELKAERNQLELNLHETEAKLRQCEQNLKDHSASLADEVTTWRDQCESARAASSRRELEIQTIAKKADDLEDALAACREEQAQCEEECEELRDAKHDAQRAREESRRLLQERAENQQVIQLLEMQKEILAKTSEGSMSKVHDAQQLQYQIEQLTIERDHLEEKLSLVEQREKSRSHLQTCADDEDVVLSVRERLCEVEAQNHQLRALNNRITEQLTTVEQENVTTQAKFRDCVPKADLKSVERERAVAEESLSHLRSQYDRLDTQYKQARSDEKTRTNDSQDLFVVQKEKASLAHHVELLTRQITDLEENRQLATDRSKELEKQLDALHEKLFNVCQEDNSQVLQLQKQVNNLTTELEGAKRLHTQQDTMLEALKQDLEEQRTKNPSKITQSLDSVGEDLTALRQELTQLGQVILSKDAEIEQLDIKLRQARERLADRDKQIEILTTGTGSGKDEDDGCMTSYSMELSKKKLEQKIEELEEENDEIEERIAKIRRERDLAVKDAEDLRDGLDDLQKICDTDHIKRLEQLRKELSAKDRQIESLEEQLRRNTNFEIKKLKRGASKMDLLKAENRRLQSQISPPTNNRTRHSSSPDQPSSPQPTSPSPPEVKSIGSRLGDRLQGDGPTPSQRLLDRLHSDNGGQERSVSSLDSSDGEETADPSATLLDDLNNRSMSRLHGKPEDDEQNSSESMKSVRRSWQKRDEDELTASSKALRPSLHSLGKLSDRVSSLKGNGLQGEVADSSPLITGRSESMTDLDKASSEPKSILKWSSRYDLLDASTPTHSSYKKEAFRSRRSSLSRVDFLDPNSDFSLTESASSPTRSRSSASVSPPKLSGGYPSVSSKTDALLKGSTYSPKLTSSSPSSVVPSTRLGKLSGLDVKASPKPLKSFPWQSKASTYST